MRHARHPLGQRASARILDARTRGAVSVTVGMSPDAVVELLNYVMEGPEFEDERFFALRAAAGTGFRTGSRFQIDIYKLVQATRPGTEEHQAGVKAGIDHSFGLGVSPKATRSLFSLCCGDAAVRGCTEFEKADVLRLVHSAFAHRMQFKDDSPSGDRHVKAGLPKLADWALRDWRSAPLTD